MNQRMDGDRAQSVSQQVYSPEMTERLSGVTRHEEPRLWRTYRQLDGWAYTHSTVIQTALTTERQLFLTHGNYSTLIKANMPLENTTNHYHSDRNERVECEETSKHHCNVHQWAWEWNPFYSKLSLFQWKFKEMVHTKIKNVIIYSL